MSTMTPAAICETLSAANDLSDETLAPLLEYRSAKRRTGCPDALEIEVIRAARKCQETVAELRCYLEKAAKEATEALAGLDARGTKYERTWFYLECRQVAEQMGQRLRAEREQFNGLLRAWAAVADRIHATAAEKAAKEQEQRDALTSRWGAETFATIRAAAKRHNVSGTDKRSFCEALAAAGVTP